MSDRIWVPGSSDPPRGTPAGHTDYNLNLLLHKMRDELPPCKVCDKPCDPDELPPGVTILFIHLDDLGDRLGMIPVHQGACEAEARDRLQKGQAEAERKRRLDTVRLREDL